MGAAVAFACAVVFAALLGSGAPSAGAEAACPNEAIRVAQQVTQVGSCRAFEKVTPVDKGGGDIVAEGATTTAAADGNAVAFESRMGFAGSEGSGTVGKIAYLSRRGSTGWTTGAVTPRPNPNSPGAFGGTAFEFFSEDLSHGLARSYDLPGAADSTPDRVNLYRVETATRDLLTVSRSQTGEGDPMQYPWFEFLSEVLWASSADLSHTSFVSAGQMVPAIPGEYPNGANNAYTWDEGTLHLAGVLPDGTVPPGGSTIKEHYRGGMSADGSRLAFLASPAFGPQQLYLRIDHSRTELVSESENPAYTEEPQEVHFEGMTPDGMNLFFVTNSPLLEEDSNVGPDLYRWAYGPDPANEANLTMITDSGSAHGGGGIQTLLGMSDDGEQVYTHEQNAMVKVWDSGAVTNIGLAAGSPNQSYTHGLNGFGPGYSRVSPDGNWLAYVPRLESQEELYLYNLTADTLICVSCPGELAQSTNRPAFTPNLTDSGRTYSSGFRPRYLSDSGKAFFTSPDSLVAQDINGVADVYEFDGNTGELNLVSSGRGGAPSEFFDASRNGDDVFFMTRQQLVPSDKDESIDIYDARAGGGFDEPEGSPVAPCSGEACQSISGTPPPPPVIASGAVSRGNLRPSRRCSKNRRKVRRHGKVRCIKRHGGNRHDRAHHQRDANRTRGGVK